MLEPSAGPVGGITVVERPDATIARLWGGIDEALREQASSALARALDRELPVVIETSEVEFIDSTGIAFLIQFCRIGREEGLAVSLANPPAIVTNVLTMLGLEEMFSPTGTAHGDCDSSVDARDAADGPVEGSPAADGKDTPGGV